MLFKQDVLERIATGEVTLAYRRWRRPSVKSGGTLLTPAGLLAIRAVEVVDPQDITPRDARRAGYDSLASLRASLNKYRAGRFYRIEFFRQGNDPRIALRAEDELSAEDLAKLLGRLERLDQRSPSGPWTRQILALIGKHPERRAADLAAQSNFEKEWLKLNVRKLKNLGLTESLNPGYRLSPRGKKLLAELTRPKPRRGRG